MRKEILELIKRNDELRLALQQQVERFRIAFDPVPPATNNEPQGDERKQVPLTPDKRK